ncbi:MAG TPA: NADH-quinone oxidoreductase subunit M [Chitinophagaceae bacterium]|nr:NADH-quinone oxidoreductase subunit M [Chitinophagaceae bacterium]
MISLLLILIPLLSGVIAFFLKQGNSAKSWALVSSFATVIVSLLGLTVLNKADLLQFKCDWLPGLGSSFSIRLDGMGQLLCLLTSISFPLIFITTWHRQYKNAHNFFALMLLSQAGLMGVFLAMDALLFYFFWELALIPVYFLCSIWGAERRIQATFKFFIYTFIGSLLMLVGLIYLQSQTADKSFDIDSFYTIVLKSKTQNWVFWLMFVAFAIKIPVFPFHSWQPDTYEQSPTAVTMVLSGIMVKMGVFAIIRWLLPVLPSASFAYGEKMIAMWAIAGMLYASLLAWRQDDLKRLIAYSSIAHLGLMVVAIFSESEIGMQGVMIQMFNHGINIIGLWVVVEILERKYDTRKLSELGGLAQKAPVMSMLFVIVVLANIALPLTNAFVGEFMMFTGIFTSPISDYEMITVPAAGFTIILGAIYMLRMVQKVIYGNTNALTENGSDIGLNEKLVLGIIVMLILVGGVYPQPFLDLTQDTTNLILKEANVIPLMKK